MTPSTPSGQASLFSTPFDGEPVKSRIFTPAEVKERAEAFRRFFEGNPPESFSSAIAARNAEPESVEESIQRAGSDPLWDVEALKVVENLCKSRLSFDLDDVAALVPPNREPRSTGRIMTKAKALKWCRQSGVGRSKRPSRHGGYISVYESLLFVQP